MASFSSFSVTHHAQAAFAGAVHVCRRILFDFPAVQALMDFPEPGSHGGLFLPWCFEGAVNCQNESWGKCVLFFFLCPSEGYFHIHFFYFRKKDQQSVPVPQEGVADTS